MYDSKLIERDVAKIEVLLASKEDVCAVAELSYEVGKLHDEEMPWYFMPSTLDEHLQIITEMLESKTEVVFKAVCKGEICGFLCLYVPQKERKGFVYAKTGVILNMGVDKRYRRKGIGTALISGAEKYLTERGIGALELGVYMFNESAYRLYGKLGFTVLERQMFKRLK